ncbi:MAG TPA: alpha-amylase family glycosyl hydrolase [Longimicrobium sp.]|nr:alpha-amylase family glycosyl hydrolase [Longimicrobium sp.]
MKLEERIGAWPVAEGCFFRVWAPHAQRVAVLVQDPPSWEVDEPGAIEHDLVREGDYWSATVPEVHSGQLYRYRIETPDGEVLQRLDPAARDVLSSELTRHDPESRNGSVVPAAGPFAWEAEFTPPRFENFIIYQLHVGSFAGRGDGLEKGWATFADIETKLPYIREMGFNCIQPLPVHEFQADRSWGYNPASFFAPESSYGTPHDLAHLVDAAHRHGLAVIFDVVYNHAGPGDSVLWEFDGYREGDGGIYFEGGQMTHWGRGPAWWKPEVQDFFYQNARMFLEEYRADGLRFDVTTQIDGEHLKLVVDRLRRDFPDRYLVAEHLPDDPWIVDTGRFCATWHADTHHQTQRALAGHDPLARVRGILGWEGYGHAWNLVKYALGSHDDIGDQSSGNAEDGLTSWDRRHRYLVDQLGGRESWHARAKCRLAWALNVAMPGTPMLFMGSECHMAAPHVGWGYWHDGADDHGDHRFHWGAAGDDTGREMRRLVAACNAVRWQNPALRAGSLRVPHEDRANQVLGFLREHEGNVLLVVVNLGEQSFTDRGYGVRTGGHGGQWTQVLCTQDAAFGGWDGAGNAFHEPWTQGDGHVYINLPGWSVVILRRG